MRYAHVIYYIAGDLITSIMRVALCQVKYDARRPAGPRTCADHRDESVSLSNAASSVQICVPHSASAFIVSQSHSALSLATRSQRPQISIRQIYVLDCHPYRTRTRRQEAKDGSHTQGSSIQDLTDYALLIVHHSSSVLTMAPFTATRPSLSTCFV